MSWVRENVTAEDDGKCRYCDGTGQVPAEWDENEMTQCQGCNGTGQS